MSRGRIVTRLGTKMLESVARRDERLDRPEVEDPHAVQIALAAQTARQAVEVTGRIIQLAEDDLIRDVVPVRLAAAAYPAPAGS